MSKKNFILYNIIIVIIFILIRLNRRYQTYYSHEECTCNKQKLIPTSVHTEEILCNKKKKKEKEKHNLKPIKSLVLLDVDPIDNKSEYSIFNRTSKKYNI